MNRLQWLAHARPQWGDVTVKTWVVLTGASTLATLGVIPYSLSLGRDSLAEARQRAAAAGKSLPPLPVLVVASTAQSGLLFGLLAALGLRAAKRQGLGAPHLAALLRGEPAGWEPLAATRAVGAGVAATGAMLVLEYTAFRGLHTAKQQTGQRTPAAWKGLLATPYGAIAEEVLMRLGLQTLCAAGIRRLSGETAMPPGPRTTWPAIAIASLLFGAGHLPAARRVMPLTPLFVARTLALNGVGGLVFGYLYWRQGLEAAMLAHGTADLLLHVATPLRERARTATR